MRHRSRQHSWVIVLVMLAFAVRDARGQCRVLDYNDDVWDRKERDPQEVIRVIECLREDYPEWRPGETPSAFTGNPGMVEEVWCPSIFLAEAYLAQGNHEAFRREWEAASETEITNCDQTFLRDTIARLQGQAEADRRASVRLEAEKLKQDAMDACERIEPYLDPSGQLATECRGVADYSIDDPDAAKAHFQGIQNSVIARADELVDEWKTEWNDTVVALDLRPEDHLLTCIRTDPPDLSGCQSALRRLARSAADDLHAEMDRVESSTGARSVVVQILDSMTWPQADKAGLDAYKNARESVEGFEERAGTVSVENWRDDLEYLRSAARIKTDLASAEQVVRALVSRAEARKRTNWNDLKDVDREICSRVQEMREWVGPEAQQYCNQLNAGGDPGSLTGYENALRTARERKTAFGDFDRESNETRARILADAGTEQAGCEQIGTAADHLQQVVGEASSGSFSTQPVSVRFALLARVAAAVQTCRDGWKGPYRDLRQAIIETTGPGAVQLPASHAGALCGSSTIRQIVLDLTDQTDGLTARESYDREIDKADLIRMRGRFSTLLECFQTEIDEELEQYRNSLKMTDRAMAEARRRLEEVETRSDGVASYWKEKLEALESRKPEMPETEAWIDHPETDKIFGDSWEGYAKEWVTRYRQRRETLQEVARLKNVIEDASALCVSGTLLNVARHLDRREYGRARQALEKAEQDCGIPDGERDNVNYFKAYSLWLEDKDSGVVENREAIEDLLAQVGAPLEYDTVFENEYRSSFRQGEVK